MRLMCRSRKFCQRGSNTDSFVFVFLVDRMERIEMPLKVGHHWPASETPLKWQFAGMPIMECWLGRFVIFRGSRSILLGNPIFL